jgi:tetratricopeptide (TPR) repeat protein
MYNLAVARRRVTIAWLAMVGAMAIPAGGQGAAQQLQAASEYLQHGDVRQAIRECKVVLSADPRSAPAHLLLGQAYLAQGETAMLAEAKAELQQALDLDPSLLWAHFYLARIYLDLGLNEKAKEHLEGGLQLRPDVPHFLSLLGETDRLLGNPAASLELNRKALQIDAGMTPAHYYMALAYQDLKQDQAAMRELEGAVDSKYVTPEMYVALAALYGKVQRLAEAENLCRKAIALDGSRPAARLALARLYNARQSSDQALEALRLALPDGKQMGASAFYQQLQADIFFERGIAYQDKKMPDQAIQAYTRALDFDPNRAEARRRLAELYLAK